MQKINCRRSLTVILALLSLASCSKSGNVLSHAEHNGLVVEFKALCVNEDLTLQAAIYNSSAKQIRIESGVLPWEDDALGTHFELLTAGRSLERKFFPIIDRFGPIELAPQERRSGEVPIGYSFPEMKLLLKDNQVVTVKWSYIDALGGEFQIKRNLCE